jgi:hypothetical protein
LISHTSSLHGITSVDSVFHSHCCQKLTSYRIIKIKHTFRKRAVQPITTEEEGTILSHNTVYHFNKHSTNKSNEDKHEQYDERRLEIISRSSTLQAPTQYDYDSITDEYYNYLQKELNRNISFNYTLHDRYEETIEDAINEIFYYNKTTKNCSKEEYSNFGIKSMLCSWEGLKQSRTKQDKTQFFKRLMRTVAIWLLICTVIGATCACEFGKHKCRVLLFIMSLSTALHKATGTSCDSCHVQRHDKRGTR